MDWEGQNGGDGENGTKEALNETAYCLIHLKVAHIAEPAKLSRKRTLQPPDARQRSASGSIGTEAVDF